MLGALAASAALSGAVPAHAAPHRKQPPAARADVPAAKSLGTFDAWTAYEAEDKTGRVCYLAGSPQKSEPAGVARKTPMAMVTHRPAENVANVVSFVEGYPLKEGSNVTLQVGRHRFELFTNGDSAWARTSDLDREIVTTLAESGDVVAKGRPEHGPATTDVYSLAGFSKALAAIDKACGVKREEERHRPAERHPARHHSHHTARHS